MITTLRIMIIAVLLMGSSYGTTERGMVEVGERQSLNEIVSSRCRHYHLDEKVIRRMISVESDWRIDAFSSEGACGLMQILPATACDIMDDSTITSERLRTDERLNIEAGLKYLAFLRRTFSGDLKLALLAYNRGPATVQKLLAQGIDPSNGYERKVMKNL